MIEHPELENFKVPGGIFDVEPCEMDLKIGMRGLLISPKFPAETKPFTVVGVQLDWSGKKCWRVVHDDDAHKFGRVLSPDSLILWL